MKAGGAEEQRFTVYIGITADEEPALRAAAAEVFGPEWFAVIEPGTVNGQNAPELAFHVVAASPDEAVPISSDSHESAESYGRGPAGMAESRSNPC